MFYLFNQSFGQARKFPSVKKLALSTQNTEKAIFMLANTTLAVNTQIHG